MAREEKIARTAMECAALKNENLVQIFKILNSKRHSKRLETRNNATFDHEDWIV
jgi:hypothetical protein